MFNNSSHYEIEAIKLFASMIADLDPNSPGSITVGTVYALPADEEGIVTHLTKPNGDRYRVTIAWICNTKENTDVSG